MRTLLAGRRLPTLALSLSCLLLAACVQVPDSGPVHAGPQVGSDEAPVLRFDPSGPPPGADQIEVIKGYLDAMRAHPADPGIVRQFLTDGAAGRWSPSTGTQIYTDRPDIQQGPSGSTVGIDTGLVAGLNSRGEWTPLPQSERHLHKVFRLQRQRGEWRIANPASGLLIPVYDFDRYYDSYSLFFFDPTLRVLAPDPVYLPQGDQTATLLLRGLLQGPTSWLRGAVISVLPRGEHGDVSVPVSDDGVAHVQLGSPARRLGTAERELLGAQLFWTLRQVPDVESVRVTVNGAPFPLVNGSNVAGLDVGADFDPADSAASRTLYALQGDHVVSVDAAEGTAERVAGRFGSGAVPVDAFAVERAGQTIAGVTHDRTRVEVAPMGSDSAQTWFGDGQSLLGVQWDLHGLLWAVDRTRTGSAVYVMREGGWRRVAMPGHPPDDIRAFALSRDGVRLAVVDGSGASSRLLVGRVRRPANGSLGLSVGRWRQIASDPFLHSFRDVTWSSPTDVTVVAEQGQGSPQAFKLGIDGSTVEPSPLMDLGVSSVADAPVVDLPAVLSTGRGSLFVELPDRWRDLGLEGRVSQPGYVE